MMVTNHVFRLDTRGLPADESVRFSVWHIQWLTPVIPPLERLRQEDPVVETSLERIIRFCFRTNNQTNEQHLDLRPLSYGSSLCPFS